MSKITWYLGILLWGISLVLLVAAYTDVWPNHTLSHYRYLLGIGFIVLTGLLKEAYRKRQQ